MYYLIISKRNADTKSLLVYMYTRNMICFHDYNKWHSIMNKRNNNDKFHIVIHYDARTNNSFIASIGYSSFLSYNSSLHHPFYVSFGNMEYFEIDYSYNASEFLCLYRNRLSKFSPISNKPFHMNIFKKIHLFFKKNIIKK